MEEVQKGLEGKHDDKSPLSPEPEPILHLRRYSKHEFQARPAFGGHMDAGGNLPAQSVTELAGVDSVDGGSLVATQIMDVSAGLERAYMGLGQFYLLGRLSVRRHLDCLCHHQPAKSGRPDTKRAVPKVLTKAAERRLVSRIRLGLSGCYSDCKRALLVVDPQSRQIPSLALPLRFRASKLFQPAKPMGVHCFRSYAPISRRFGVPDLCAANTQEAIFQAYSTSSMAL